MKIEYDKDVDALYICIQEKNVAKTREIEEGLNVDIDEEGKVIGFEILDATQRYSKSEIFTLSTENLVAE
jgi:uncharacterized protein YuzE